MSARYQGWVYWHAPPRGCKRKSPRRRSVAPGFWFWPPLTWPRVSKVFAFHTVQIGQFLAALG